MTHNYNPSPQEAEPGELNKAGPACSTQGISGLGSRGSPCLRTKNESMLPCLNGQQVLTFLSFWLFGHTACHISLGYALNSTLLPSHPQFLYKPCHFLTDRLNSPISCFILASLESLVIFKVLWNVKTCHSSWPQIKWTLEVYGIWLISTVAVCCCFPPPLPFLASSGLHTCSPFCQGQSSSSERHSSASLPTHPSLIISRPSLSTHLSCSFPSIHHYLFFVLFFLCA